MKEKSQGRKIGVFLVICLTLRLRVLVEKDTVSLAPPSPPHAWRRRRGPRGAAGGRGASGCPRRVWAPAGGCLAACGSKLTPRERSVRAVSRDFLVSPAGAPKPRASARGCRALAPDACALLPRRVPRRGRLAARVARAGSRPGRFRVTHGGAVLCAQWFLRGNMRAGSLHDSWLKILFKNYGGLKASSAGTGCQVAAAISVRRVGRCDEGRGRAFRAGSHAASPAPG